MKMADLAKLSETGRFRKKTFNYSIDNKENKTGLSMGKLVNENARGESASNSVEHCYNDCLEFIKSVFKRAEVDFGIMPSCQQLNDIAGSEEHNV